MTRSFVNSYQDARSLGRRLDKRILHDVTLVSVLALDIADVLARKWQRFPYFHLGTDGRSA